MRCFETTKMNKQKLIKSILITVLAFGGSAIIAMILTYAPDWVIVSMLACAVCGTIYTMV